MQRKALTRVLPCEHCKNSPRMPKPGHGFTVTMTLDANAVDFCERDRRWYHRVISYAVTKSEPFDPTKFKTESELIREITKEIRDGKDQK